MTKILSKTKSMKGWRFSEWFKGNWSTLKELLKVGIPLVVGLVATSNPVWTTIIVIVGKLVADTGEYYFKQINN